MVKKAFKNALLVQIISAIVGVIGMVVDGVVTGSCLGTEYMAGYGLATPVVTIFIACSGVCGLGASLLIGRLVGARRIKEASEALSSCLAFALVLSLVLIAAVLLFADKIAVYIGAAGETAVKTADYLRGFSLCAPALLILTVLMPVLQIDGKQNVVVLAVVVMTAVNIAGDLLVGFVCKGAGLFGMALATSVSYFAALLLTLPFLFRKDKTLRISFKHLKLSYIGEMVSGGLSSALQQVCRSLLILVLNRLLLKLAAGSDMVPDQAVAVFTAIMSAANLCMVLGSGIGSSVSMLTGVFVGDRDDKAIGELVQLALKKAVLYDAALCAVLCLCAGFIMPMFMADAAPALIQTAVTGFRLYCLSMIGYSVNVTLRLYYQAMHRTGLSYIYVACNSFLFTALGAWILGSAFGVTGVWLAFLFGETLSLLLPAVYVLLKTEKGARFTERLLCIPPELTADILDRYDGRAETGGEMASVSEAVRLFCRKNGAAERTAYALSLAAEELGEYILKNNGAGRNETVEVRVLSVKDSWTMRIRDNGSRFDPLTVLKEEKPDDFSYIGIRLAMDMVHDIRYLDTLNINNLNMEIKK